MLGGDSRIEGLACKACVPKVRGHGGMLSQSRLVGTVET